METIFENNINQQYIKTGSSICLSGAGAVCGTKVLRMSAAKISHKIITRTIKKLMSNNETYKKASKIVLARENIRYADLSVTKDAFKRGTDPEFDKIQQQQSKKIINIVNARIAGLLNMFKTKKKIQQEAKEKEQMYYAGRNACAIYNKVFANFEKLAFTLPHEMGHVKNFLSNGFFAKCLQTMRGTWFNKIGLIIAFSGAIFLSPSKDSKSVEKQQTITTKTKNFIKNHCVAIGAIAVLPTILEEGLASLKAKKLMKGVLSKPDLKAMNKANTIAFLSYVLTNSAIVGGIYIANNVRNHTAFKNNTDANI